MKVAENDEFRTDSAPDFESKDRLPDLLEKDSPDKVSNNTEVEDSVDTTKRGKASIWLPKVWDGPSLQIKASNIELEKIDNNPSCKAMNQPSILQEVPAHKAIKAEVEPKKANNPSEKAPEAEISKQRYNKSVQIADSKRLFIDVSDDKGHDKDDIRKNVHIISVANNQPNDAYMGLKTEFRSTNQNSKVAKDDETEHTQGSTIPPNTMETENDEDANIDSTEDGTKDNLNPSTLNVNKSITRVRLEVENNEFISANGRRILKSTTCSTSMRDL